MSGRPRPASSSARIDVPAGMLAGHGYLPLSVTAAPAER